jgi:hypothetical protein
MRVVQVDDEPGEPIVESADRGDHMRRAAATLVGRAEARDCGREPGWRLAYRRSQWPARRYGISSGAALHMEATSAGRIAWDSTPAGGEVCACRGGNADPTGIGDTTAPAAGTYNEFDDPPGWDDRDNPARRCERAGGRAGGQGRAASGACRSSRPTCRPPLRSCCTFTQPWPRRRG